MHMHILKRRKAIDQQKAGLLIRSYYQAKSAIIIEIHLGARAPGVPLSSVYYCTLQQKHAQSLTKSQSIMTISIVNHAPSFNIFFHRWTGVWFAPHALSPCTLRPCAQMVEIESLVSLKHGSRDESDQATCQDGCRWQPRCYTVNWKVTCGKFQLMTICSSFSGLCFLFVLRTFHTVSPWHIEWFCVCVSVNGWLSGFCYLTRVVFKTSSAY